MMGVGVKPLSVNQCWQGKRFKTKTYKAYEKELLTLLPKITIPKGNIKLSIEWGFSSAASDIDNPLKPFIDILQKKYDFNDKWITELIVKKKKCKKGAEYILFEVIGIE